MVPGSRTGEQRERGGDHVANTFADAATVRATDGTSRSIGSADVVPAAKAGEVIVIAKALQRVGFFETLIETTFAAIQHACGSARADECRRLGIERMHEVLDVAGLEDAVHEIDRRLAVPAPRLMKALGRGPLGLQRSFYIYASSRVRFMVPQGIVSSDRGRFHSRANRLQLGEYEPHRDYWEGVPINAVNFWMALGKVQPDNGMSIYPDMWERRVLRDGIAPQKGQDFGTPLNLALEPGDVIVFDNRQLHASTINNTSSTRAVLTGRLCTEQPIAPSAEMLERTSFWSPLIGTPLERFAGAATKVSWTYAVERLKRRATSAIAAVERRTGGKPFHTARQALRYRRGDRPFGI